MRYLTIFTFIGLLLSQPLQAADTRGLYEAGVGVSDQSRTTRAGGMREAMRAVLLKVTGSSRVNEDRALAEAMKSPSRYVQQYRYLNAPGGAEGNLTLQVSFDQKSIDDLLRSHGFTIWGDARPATLIWLGVEDGGSRVLVGAKDRGVLRELIVREAEHRALPVSLPLMDSTDHRRVASADVWGEFFDPIKEASQRYHAQAILVGRLYPLSSRNWEARWALLYQGKVKRWQEQAASATSLITVMMGLVTDHLAQSFAQSFDSGSGEWLIRVEDVRSLEDYRRVVDYLKGVHGVKQVTAESLSSDAVLLRLTTSGGSGAVRQVIGLGNTLKQNESYRMRYAPGGRGEPRMRPEALPPGAAYSGSQTVQPGLSAEGFGAEETTASASTVSPAEPEVVYRLLP